MAREQVEALEQAFDDLRLALGSGDPARMILAGETVRLACDAVRTGAGAELDGETRLALENLLPMVEATRVHINLAADDARQRIDLLAQQGIETATATYAR